MSTDRRLDRLYPALSANERAILILRAWKAGEGHDPKIRYTIPSTQVQEYTRLIGLLRGASGDLTHFIVIVSQMVEQLSLRWCWLASLHLAALNACDMAETALSLTSGRKEKAAVRRALKPRVARFAVSLYGDPRWGKADRSQRMTGDAIAEGLVAGMREAWPQRWRELRAAEIVVAEIAGELDGEDPMDIEVPGLLDKCRADLLDLRSTSNRTRGIWCRRSRMTHSWDGCGSSCTTAEDVGSRQRVAHPPNSQPLSRRGDLGRAVAWLRP